MPTGIWKRTEEHNKKLRVSHIGSGVYKHKPQQGFQKGHEESLGAKNGNWKGDDTGYRALHGWIERKLGKAKICKYCGKEKTTPKSIHWANKSHNYNRKLTDWISLCVPCHKKYDIEYRKNLI